MKFTTEVFKERVRESVGNEYTVLGEYTNNHTKILMRHNSDFCGDTEYEVTPKGFLRGNRCPQCCLKRRGKKPKTTEQFRKELFDMVGEEYTLVGEYNGVFNKLTLLHNTCGREWKVTPNAFISSKSRCFYCRIAEHNRNQLKTQEKFESEIENKYPGEYKVLGDYIGSNKKIKVQHKCGHEWDIRASHLLDKPMCPNCKMSNGERYVSQYLNNKGILFEEQKKFEDLKYKKGLSYDFYLPEYNILIEYQGVQHYFPIEQFGGTKGFESQKFRDNIKREYAISKGIKLIEIRYTRKTYKSVETFLDKELKLLV